MSLNFRSREGGILDPDDRVADVCDDREQLEAIFDGPAWVNVDVAPQQRPLDSKPAEAKSILPLPLASSSANNTGERTAATTKPVGMRFCKQFPEIPICLPGQQRSFSITVELSKNIS